MRSRVIDISHHNTYEDWLVVNEDGTIIYHFELDGAAAARKGCQPRDEPRTFEQVCQEFPGQAQAVEQALKEFGKGP